MKYFEIDYKFPESPEDVHEKLFRYEDEQPLAERFCAEIKEQGALINIRIINRD